MTAYEASGFEPPAPVTRVAVRNPENGEFRPAVAMLLDTGADVSLVPRTTLDELGVIPDDHRRYELVGFDGRSSLVPVAHLELVFCGRSFRGQFLLVEQPFGVLGRNSEWALLGFRRPEPILG